MGWAVGDRGVSKVKIPDPFVKTALADKIPTLGEIDLTTFDLQLTRPELNYWGYWPVRVLCLALCD